MTDRPRPARTEPLAARPHVPKGYGVPSTPKGLLPWSHVIERMMAVQNYWVSSTRPNGRPHVVPVWGVWVDDTFFHGGGDDTRKARNLQANPHVAVHLESGDEVVILEGTVDILTQDNADPDLLRRIDDAYEAKYGMRHGTPVWALRPTMGFGWTLKGFPKNMTRWSLPAEWAGSPRPVRDRRNTPLGTMSGRA